MTVDRTPMPTIAQIAASPADEWPYATRLDVVLACAVIELQAALERRDTPDEGSGRSPQMGPHAAIENVCKDCGWNVTTTLHLDCCVVGPLRKSIDAAIARAETAERKLAVRTIDRDVCFEACKKVCAERDAERERAGRLEVRIAKLRRCLERFTASGSWLPDLGRTWAAFALSEDDAALALPASDTKENVS